MHFVRLSKTGTLQTITHRKKSRRQPQQIRLICHLILGNSSLASIEFRTHDANGIDEKKIA